MTQIVTLTLSLLLANTGVLAQPTGAAAFAAGNGGDNHDIAELQGCLERDKGYYILIDKNNEFQRLSENKNLKKLVGHEVKVTGTPSIRTLDNTLQGGSFRRH